MIDEKKGLLLAEETLKIIIALISLTFLVFFLSSLYFSNLNEKRFEQAKQELTESSESFKSIIENLDEGEEKEKKLTSPSGWFLFSFTEKRPNACAGQNCMCICDEANFYQEQFEVCQEKGICYADENLDEFDEIEINPDKDISVSIKKENGKILIN